jgi:ribose transport system ATP-binding protein
MISSEMAEVLGMADRIFVVHDGVTTGELSKEEMCEENVINLAMGIQ